MVFRYLVILLAGSNRQEDEARGRKKRRIAGQKEETRKIGKTNRHYPIGGWRRSAISIPLFVGMARNRILFNFQSGDRHDTL